MFHCSKCTQLHDEDILFLNVDPIKDVLHPVCTEDVHIALGNDHSSLNDPTTTLKESIWVQKLHSAITAIF